MTDELSRIARLEQKVADTKEIVEDHLNVINERLNKNDEMHEKLIGMVTNIQHVLEKFNWLARGMGLVLLAIGMAGGWFLEKWHMLMGWLGK